ncbi:MAG: pGP6-D family virulence protein [Verrucomicrobia bacterium]|nr:pGP6-D family virulence protein [Verrucomicrobiota bacterium]MBU6446460.1 pGP6-D family virulence protein [Verrucomicrobiota bacterium]MDE3046836.1 CT583 family protein [Verrucomicrobiota bacterium]
MMSKFNDLLHLRFNKNKDAKEKMSALVEKANNGELSSFSGVFRVAQLNEKEKADIENILRTFRVNETDDLEADLKTLMAITSEVKAITNQAVILHGERIKRAQDILKRYRDGAFTAWLFATYGNRQTPYNFLQYYEFYTLLPQTLHPKLDQMPRQAVYSLASRVGAFQKKEEIVKNYTGQPKEELLKLIRLEFPLAEDDKRLPHFTHNAILHLKRARDLVKNRNCMPREEEKQTIRGLLRQIETLLDR